MFNKEEVRQQIIQYFRSVGSGENIIQAIKQALFLNENFSPLLLFEMLSQGKQKICRQDWKKYLLSKNISFSEEQIKYFFRHNHFRQQIILSEFLQAMIPYNADVIRQFKAKYLDSLEIRQMDPQVQFLFAELMSNWIGFFRNLIQIRSQLSNTVNRKQIQHLIKEDLVLHSKPREARKFHESFQQRNFELSFHQLRKFLQLWVSSKQLLHQFCLLNVKRHIKCQNPFQKIVYRLKKSGKSGKSRSRSFSGSKSASKRKSPPQLSGRIDSLQKNNQIKQKKFNAQEQSESERDYLNSVKKQTKSYQQNPYQSKYQQYKRQLKNGLNQQKYAKNQMNQIKYKQRQQVKYQRQNHKSNQKKYVQEYINRQPKFQYRNQNKQAKYNRDPSPKGQHFNQRSKNNQCKIIVKIFQQIVLRESRLQKLRKQLVKLHDFNLINLFKIIDSNNKGYINATDLQNFIQQPHGGIDKMMRFYSRQENKLRLQQFSMLFRPLSKQLNQNLDKRQEHRVPNPFKRETIRLINQIIRLEADMHLNLAAIKNRIRESGLGGKKLFQYVDSQNQGFITSQSVRELLQQNNVNCETKDIKCLMRRFHKKIDERISLKQFISFIDF